MSQCEGSCPVVCDQSENESKEIVVSVEKSSVVSRIRSGKHTFYSDETQEWGGKNRYPDPWDYIIGGLGACITTTIRQYADQHKIKLERAEVELEYRYNEESVKSPYIIDKKIKLYGDLSDEEKSRLILVSNSPAQKMLEKGMDVRLK